MTECDEIPKYWLTLQQKLDNMTRQEFSTILRKLQKGSLATIRQSWPYVLYLPTRSKIDAIENGTESYKISEALTYMNVWGAQMEISYYSINDCITTMDEVRAALKTVREELGISISRLSAATGVSPKAIRNFENGTSDMKIEAFLKLMEALDCLFVVGYQK